MILDDRPVIDQLLNPTPLNIVHEVEAHMDTLIDGSEYALGDLIHVTLMEELGWAHLLMGDEGKRFMKSLDSLAGLLADGECSRRQALMELMAKELEARL